MATGLTCVGCKKSIGLLGRLSYDKHTGLCGSCGAMTRTTAPQQMRHSETIREEKPASEESRVSKFMRDTAHLESTTALPKVLVVAATLLNSRYRIVEELGRGGMGAVYRAVDERTGRAVALKRMLVEANELKRAFKREADLLANLKHRALPKVSDRFSVDTEQYLVMDYVGGADLQTLLEEKHKRFTVENVLSWADELLDALGYLHGHTPPILHRDIKPANLKLTEGGRVMLLDFGLAKGAAGEMTHAGNSLSVFGYTPHYASLEQIQGDGTTPQSDIYSLGATLYHLLTGVKPTDALKRVTGVLYGKTDPLPQIAHVNTRIPKHIAATVWQAMSLKPSNRPASAAEMRNQLQFSQPATARSSFAQEEETQVRTTANTQTSLMSAGDIEDMLRSASVVRTKTIDAEAAPLQEKGEPFTELSDADKPVEPLPVLDYELPTTDFLHPAPPRHEQADDELMEIATRIAEALRAFNVTGNIEHISPGPIFTTYEFKPAMGVTVGRIANLRTDLSLALASEVVGVEQQSGKQHVSIMVTNPQRETIYFREIIESRTFQEASSKLTIALGKTVDGSNYVVDLAQMPHLLIAGATGTGKSVCLSTLIVSLLYKASPEEVKLILIDTKYVDFGFFADIPHLATPIITEPKRAANALKWAVTEMENRYKNLAKWSVRNIDGYNAEIRRRNYVKDYDDDGKPWKPLPYLVILIDELAELMMVSGHEVEESITRLAQMARAVGIHLVISTQRPSSEVLTAEIKAAFRARISFQVTSRANSRLILDANGAEHLLSRGDMLFVSPGIAQSVRVHGAYIGDDEIGKIMNFIKAQSRPEYEETITQSEAEAEDALGDGGDRDELFDQALRICVEMKRASTSVIQRRLRIGYGRACAILDAMERDGLIGAADGARPRPVLGRANETIRHWDTLEEANVKRK